MNKQDKDIKNQNKYIVYCTTNLVNNKKYIGSTTHNPNYYLGSGVLLKKAIEKYGKENFIKTILFKADSYELMREMEEYYINHFNAYKSPLFYNMSSKGSGLPEGTKLGSNSIKNSKIGLKKLGKKLSQEHCNTITKGKLGKGKTVLQFDLNDNFIKEWDTARQACIFYNPKDLNGVSACCLKKQKTAFGYKWKYKNN
jgi:hypothetical protein